MRIRIVDAFADRPFSGNPAGVLLLDAFPDDRWLQQVAAELNLSETAFAHPLPPGGDADWALRWFTPVAEVDMCGHATLATAHVLHTTGRAAGTVRFAARCGVLAADAAGDGAITMDFPTSTLTPVEPPEGLCEALGARVVSVHDTAAHVGDLLVELRDEETVRALAPDLPALAGLSGRGVIATAAAADPEGGHDFVSRCFFPRLGIDEDPVTGSAHTALAPFWSARLGRAELTGLQGGSRTGTVRTALRGGRTLLTGRAVTVVEGELRA
ncbi:PhzF family phenazine biosynthesis protein [Streptomyces somaliensis DSM 40738]|uniref:PhzF family phenazine biosynthesis protein n=1 Tax=Streptomyces somaliensis (strain ATCC 33201 / DSM 40738 / JCM 12659 / KCTC 9044 / NCTC 11332 / NRRL B-12077 / IP 733) TaxID=1134445 RepID=A0AA44ICJ4_STRE0|nr:PhzF family phenazine biosynthesis protein [Streptomyces somaliensis]MCQ0021856.1 PhzF family phenazine biosynthesis protein [Streptomyces somaliensis DSM 40738]NKY13716.1 PhzF family phenazine biosynthesis protein [Streptomyces somaliensis DSM 40738]